MIIRCSTADGVASLKRESRNTKCKYSKRPYSSIWVLCRRADRAMQLERSPAKLKPAALLVDKSRRKCDQFTPGVF